MCAPIAKNYLSVCRSLGSLCPDLFIHPNIHLLQQLRHNLAFPYTLAVPAMCGKMWPWLNVVLITFMLCKEYSFMVNYSVTCHFILKIYENTISILFPVRLELRITGEANLPFRKHSSPQLLRTHTVSRRPLTGMSNYVAKCGQKHGWECP